MVKTILCGHKDILQSVSTEVKSDYSCYKLFGVDVFLDSELKPWLLELNNFPSLEPDSLDRSGRQTARQFLFTAVRNPWIKIHRPYLELGSLVWARQADICGTYTIKLKVPRAITIILVAIYI